MQTLGPNQTRWLEALESGQYKQGSKGLSRDGEYCCLGVACAIFNVPEKGVNSTGWTLYGESYEPAIAPAEVVDALAMHNATGYVTSQDTELTALNDRGVTFNGIAALVRANPGEYFKEAR